MGNKRDELFGFELGVDEYISPSYVGTPFSLS